MNNYSDTNWGVSLPNRDILREEFKLVSSNKSNTTIKIELHYQFYR